VRQPVELEIADAIENILLRGTLAAAEHFHACQQLAESIGFGQIIVAAGTQTRDTIINLAERGEDQNRCMHALAAQFTDDGQSVAARQHAVDDGNIVGVLGAHEEAALAVACVIGNNTGLAKRLGEIGRRLEIIFDNQNLHMHDITCRGLLGTTRIGSIHGMLASGCHLSPALEPVIVDVFKKGKPREPWPARLPNALLG
jgi:hypothetical protein